MLTRIVVVGDRVQNRHGDIYTITSLSTDTFYIVAEIDKYLPKYKEYDRFIAKFEDGTLNKNMTIVE